MFGRDKKGREAVESLVRRSGVRYPVLYDATSANAGLLAIRSYPQAVLVDADGVVNWQGLLNDKSRDGLTTKIEELTSRPSQLIVEQERIVGLLRRLSDPRRRDRAAEALARVGEAALPQLLDTLAAPPPGRADTPFVLRRLEPRERATLLPHLFGVFERMSSQADALIPALRAAAPRIPLRHRVGLLRTVATLVPYASVSRDEVQRTWRRLGGERAGNLSWRTEWERLVQRCRLAEAQQMADLVKALEPREDLALRGHHLRMLAVELLERRGRAARAAIAALRALAEDEDNDDGLRAAADRALRAIVPR